MTPEQLKIHQEKVARMAAQKASGRQKEVFIFMGVAAFIFCAGFIALGGMIMSIKNTNPSYSKEEANKLLNMSYDEVQNMKNGNK